MFVIFNETITPTFNCQLHNFTRAANHNSTIKGNIKVKSNFAARISVENMSYNLCISSNSLTGNAQCYNHIHAQKRKFVHVEIIIMSSEPAKRNKVKNKDCMRFCTVVSLSNFSIILIT